ncbi:MAG: hypothetical protein SGJ00_08180 [bacterium]|nr:hypothetical protein [bacterium]
MSTLSLANLKSNWNLIKVLKITLALTVIFQAVEAKDVLLGSFGGLFLGQALLNIGCCGPQGCAVPVNKKDDKNTEDITFTEVK